MRITKLGFSMRKKNFLNRSRSSSWRKTASVSVRIEKGIQSFDQSLWSKWNPTELIGGFLFFSVCDPGKKSVERNGEAVHNAERFKVNSNGWSLGVWLWSTSRELWVASRRFSSFLLLKIKSQWFVWRSISFLDRLSCKSFILFYGNEISDSEIRNAQQVQSFWSTFCASDRQWFLSKSFQK